MCPRCWLPNVCILLDKGEYESYKRKNIFENKMTTIYAKWVYRRVYLQKQRETCEGVLVGADDELGEEFVG